MADDILNFKGDKGSSVAFGESLLAGKRSRVDESRRRQEKFSGYVKGAELLTKGTKWFLDEKVNDFNKTNTGVYTRLEGLIKQNEQVLNDQLAIQQSKLTSEQYFIKKFMDDARAQADTNNKNFRYEAVLKKAQTFGISAAATQDKLYTAAKSMSTNIEDYKESAQDTFQVSESIAELLKNKVTNLFKGQDERVVELENQKLTLEKISALKENGMFANALNFETILQAHPPTLQNTVVEILSTSSNKPKSTENSFVEVTSKDGTEKMAQLVTVLTFEDGSTKQVLGNPIKKSDIDPMQLWTDTRMNSFMSRKTALGAAYFRSLITAQDDSTAKTDDKTFAKGMAILRDKGQEGKDIIEEIMAKASSLEEYNTYLPGDGDSFEKFNRQATIKTLNTLFGSNLFNFKVEKDRIDAAKQMKLAIATNRFITSVFTGGLVGTDDDYMKNLATLSNMDDNKIIDMVRELSSFGEIADVTLNEDSIIR